MILLIYFILLYFYYRKYKSIVTIFIGLQIISLSSILLMNNDYLINSWFKVFNLSFVAIILTIVIDPWKKVGKIGEISYFNEYRIKKLTKILFGISYYNFFVLLIAGIFVTLYVNNINEFKYEAGVQMAFIYNMLPFSAKFLILSTYLYNLSYFLIPLHFYYLIKKQTRLALISLILSLNIVLFGLTFFSRWTIIHYILIYGTFYFIFNNSLNKKHLRTIRMVFAVIIIILFGRFAIVTTLRFEENVSYLNSIPLNSRIQNPIIYSNLDYLSQGYLYGMELLEDYNFKTMNGQQALSSILPLLAKFNFISSDDYINTRASLMKSKSNAFIGLVTGWIFDFGYIGTLIVALFYNYYVRKIKLKNKNISLTDSFILVLLIQIPLTSIFYSFLGGILIPIIFLIPINIYLLKTN